VDELIRKKLHRCEQATTWRYLTCSCFQRHSFFDQRWIREAFVEALAATQQQYGFTVLAWVLMPEHFHLMIAPKALSDPEATPVATILHRLKMPLAQRILRMWKKSADPRLARATLTDGSTRFWQAGGGFDRNVRDGEELWREVRYIHANPVKRGLVSSATEWEWSSARWWDGEREGPIVMTDLGAPKIQALGVPEPEAE
jgi:putative transposase